jgi:tripartite-type tricarboxylate transporter receptor subunit TctC
VRVVVPFPPGGQTDIVGRILADQFTKLWGRTAIVETRLGASGTVGSEMVAKSPPDGYTLQVAAINTHGANPALFGPKLQYDPVKDFTPIAWLVSTQNILVINKDLPYRNLKEILDYSRANPGKLTFGTAGSGSSMHLFMEVLKMMAKVDITHVPYKGSGPAVQDLMGGQITMVFDSMPGSWPFVAAGKLKPIAISSAKRSTTAPDVPTVAESGVPGYDYVSWLGLVGPAGMPKEVVTRLATELKRALAKPEVRERFAKAGTPVMERGPEEFAQYIRAENERWLPIIKASGAKIE